VVGLSRAGLVGCRAYCSVVTAAALTADFRFGRFCIFRKKEKFIFSAKK
jgi:hypothetical protein